MHTRPVTPADFDFIYNLYFHPQINPFLLYEMMEPADFQPIFDDLISRNLLYVFAPEGVDIGMFKWVPLEHRCSHIAYLGGVAIHPDYAGQGWGSRMMAAIVDFGRQRGVRRIELSTATINEKAIHLYEKAGFQREGVLRDYCWLKSQGRFLDEVMMSLILPG